MKEVFLLTKILLKSSMNSQKQEYQKKNNLFRILGWIFVYLYIGGFIGFFSFEAISSLKKIKQEAVFLNLCLLVMLGFTTMRTLFTSMNVLFFSKDTEFLLPLPIKSYKILMAKINCLIISEYLMCLIILLPAIIAYGILLNLNILFYIISIFVMLLFPVIPIMSVSLIMTVIMRFTNIFKNKDFVQYITVILSIFLVVGIQFLVGADSEVTTEKFANMMIETNGLVQVYTKTFITLKPAMFALLNFNNINGIQNLFVLFLLTIIVYVFVIFIMSKLYIKTVTNTVGGKSSKSKKDEKINFNKKTIIKSYIRKEFKDLIRNPIYFMQCIVPSFLFPAIVFISLYMGFKGIEFVELQQMKIEVANLLLAPSGIAITVAIIMFFFMLNYISITSISRDGENAVFMKYIPISLDKQCLYKIIPGIILNIVPMIFITLILKIMLQDLIVTELIITINLIALLYNVLNNYIMIIIDLKKPKLNWTTEYSVVKQNMNMLWEVLIYLIEIVILVFWGFFVQSWSFFIVSICMSLFLGITSIRNYIIKNQNILFEKIM